MNNNYEWIERKNKERDECYKKIEETAKQTKYNSKLFKQYLDIQTRFDKYSVGNALLISLQMPNATNFKTKEDWQKINITVNQNAKSFKILEPSSPIQCANGKKATYYNPKDMYDITQTNAKASDKAVLYSDEKFLKALIHICPAKVKAIDELENNLGVKFDEDQNILYVCRGMDTSKLFQTFTIELSKLIQDKSNIEDKLGNFGNYCVSYMICKKYGKTVENYNFENIPPQIQQMSVTDFRAELTTMKYMMNKIAKQIDEVISYKAPNRANVR